MRKKSSFNITPLSCADLGKLYGVHSKTFKKWINPFKEKIGKRIGRYYSIRQVKIIFRYLGLPARFNEND